MKKTLAVALATTVAATSLSAFAEDIKVLVNGTPVEFDVQPQVIEQRTMVPMRAIFEALGAEVSWEAETNKVTATNEEKTISFVIGSKEITVIDNATEAAGVVEIDVPSVAIDGRTLVPCRAVAETLNKDVQWDQENMTVVINDIVEEVSEEVALPERTVAEETAFELKENDDVVVQDLIFEEPVVVLGDKATISFVNCEFKQGIVNKSAEGTKVVIADFCNLEGQLVFDNDVKDVDLKYDFPKFIILTNAKVDVVAEESIGTVAVDFDKVITFNGVEFKAEDASLFYDEETQELVEYTDQVIGNNIVSNYMENGEWTALHIVE